MMKDKIKCIATVLVGLCLLCPALTSAVLLQQLSSSFHSNSLVPSVPNDREESAPSSYHEDWVRITDAPPRVLQATVGERLELECEAVGNAPVIQWIRGEEGVTENDNYESNTISSLDASAMDQGLSKIRSRLVINRVLPPHQGTLTCLVTSGSKSVAASTALIVNHDKTSIRSNFSALLAALPLTQPQARIVLWSPVHMSVQGSDVLLPCHAIGHPTLQVFWLDNQGEIINDQDARVKVLPDGQLHITNLEWRDMGAYTCIARNTFSKDSVSTFIYPLLNEN